MGNSLATARRLNVKNLVGFDVNGIAYAAEIGRVREIIRPLPLMPLPDLPTSIVGVADHRGVVMPVVDLRRRFGLGPSSDRRRCRWIVVARGKGLVALAVDRVTEVFGGEVVKERTVPDLARGRETQGIAAAYLHKGQLVFVVDLDRLTEVGDLLDMEAAREMFVQEKRR